MRWLGALVAVGCLAWAGSAGANTGPGKHGIVTVSGTLTNGGALSGYVDLDYPTGYVDGVISFGGENFNSDDPTQTDFDIYSSASEDYIYLDNDTDVGVIALPGGALMHHGGGLLYSLSNPNTYETSTQSYDGQSPLTLQSGSYVVTGLPEPSTWSLLIVGFGLAGCALRRTAKMRRSLLA